MTPITMTDTSELNNDSAIVDEFDLDIRIDTDVDTGSKSEQKTRYIPTATGFYQTCCC